MTSAAASAACWGGVFTVIPPGFQKRRLSGKMLSWTRQVALRTIPAWEVDLNNRPSFPPLPEAQCPRSRRQQTPRLGRAPFLVHRRHLLAVSSPGGRGGGSVGGVSPETRRVLCWGLHPQELSTSHGPHCLIPARG